MSTIHTPHDKFFKHAMRDQRVAKAFFQAHLPETLQPLVDLATLQLRQDSFIDEQLKLAMTDMLYSIEFIGKPGYLYLLAEHQSRPDPWMPFRLLKYTFQIMEQHVKEYQTTTLPLVYPLVFYHGEMRYPYSTDILDLFDDATLAEKILFKPFQLVDVTQIPDEALRHNVWLSVLELCMKHIFARDILPYLPTLLPPLQQVEQAGGEGLVTAALTYLMAAGEVSNEKVFIETIQSGLLPETGERIMTTLAQRFEARGVEKGQLEEKRIIAQRALQQGLPLETISQLTGLPLADIQQLEKAGHH